MRRIIPVVAAVFALLATMLTVAAPPAAADADAPIPLAGCTANTLESGDDAFAMAPLGFSANIGDSFDGIAATAENIYVSENGIVSFDGPVEYWYNGSELSSVASWFGDMELIAPLYADAVRDDGGSVTYGQTTWQGRSAFCVEWNDLTPYVPEFITVETPLPTNSFQLVLVERNDRATGDFDVIVNYETIGWDDTYCEEGFFGEVGFELGEGEVIELAAAPGQFNGCGCDFEGEQEFCGPVVLAFAEQLVEVQEPVFDFASVGALAGVAFPQGFSGQTIEFPGSGQILQMTDANGLAAKSLNALQAGRFVVEVTNGFQEANLGRMRGQVLGPDLIPVAQSLVSGCTQSELLASTCVTTRTGDDGRFEFGGAPTGDYVITAHSPAGSDLIAESQNFTLSSIFSVRTIPTFELEGPRPPADNVTFSPTRSSGDSTSVYWGEDLDLSVTGCAGGTATWILTASEGPSPVTGPLVEGPAGTYSGVVETLRPTHGTSSMSMTIDCPDQTPDEATDFSLYIDPAGEVREIHSGEPVGGATVVLERRGAGEIELVQVENGSEIMSPSNRVNPFVTNETAQFSWDVVPGQYRVSASAPDCVAVPLSATDAAEVLTDVSQLADMPQASASQILQVEPEWLDVNLYVDCNNTPTITDPGALTLEAPAGSADLPAPTVDDLDPADSLAAGTLTLGNNAPAQFVLDVPTDVTWTVTDDQGATASVVQTVTAVDTTAPTITDETVTIEATGPEGWTYSATEFQSLLTVTDTVDPAPIAVCGDLINPVLAVDEIAVTSCGGVDASGNQSNAATISIQVVDTTAPALQLPALDPVEADSSAGAVVTFAPSATDIVDIDVAIDCAPASGTLFEVGPTTVDCLATDDSGNADTGSFVVTVVDNSDTEAPVISGPGDFTVAADDPNGALVSFAVSATDNVDEVVDVTCDPMSGTNFGVGANVVACTAVDLAQNPATYSFTVTVEDFVVPAEDIRSQLSEISAALGAIDGLSSRESRYIDRAVSNLDRADRDSRWADGDNLADRRGYSAMSSIRYAIWYLGWVDNAEADALRSDLVSLSGQLAQNRVDQAVADGGRSYLIRWAQSKLDRGDQKRDAGYESSATWYYQSAWLYASWAS